MSRSPDAQSLFAEFLAAREEEDAPDFAAWCAARPELQQSADLRAEIERLHRAWRALVGDLERVDGVGEASFFRPRGSRGAAPRASQGALEPGQSIGPFVLQSFIAQGGMGEVWVARDQKLRRNVALKFVLPGRVDSRSVELFAREARAGGRLAHPNIVTTLAHGSDGGLSWIAQELVEGSWTLKDFLDELRAADSVPKDYYPKVADLVAQLADALAAAHEAGVIHRDVKPQNVLIAPDDRPKLTDFGLARVVDDSVLSRSGDFAGTYAYMSPEQVTAKRMGLDHRSDVFSLGIVLYELLTLRRPFEGDTTHQIAAKIITFDPPDAAKIRSQCPRDLAVICAKALEKNPDRRFQTMREFVADLRRHLANEPILARPSGAWTHAVKWVKRHPVVSSSGAVAGLAFAIVAALLVDKARTNTKLELANDQLGQANTNLSEQTQIAKDNATLAEQKLADVLSLSATRNLERLIDQAKDLVPPTPEMVPRYEAWLREARELLDGKPADPQTGAPARPSLADHRAKLAELQERAKPETDPARLEEARAHERFAELEAVRAKILWYRRMLGEERWPDRAEVEAQLALEKLPRISLNLNSLAWAIVDPAAPWYGEEVRALILVERALDKARASDISRMRNTLAWAQFRLGQFEEALASGGQALGEAGGNSFGASTEALYRAVAAWAPEARDERLASLARLRERQMALEIEVGERCFANEDDAWWNVQLTGLVSGIEALHDPRTGLAGNTLNAAFGWGIVKRYEFARTTFERSIDGIEAQHLWAEAIAAIKASAKYGGLDLTPQLGLLPIGMDLDSQLWEFAHLQSGDVAERVDGKLVLTDSSGIILVLIPGGTFTMGAQATDPSGRNYDRAARINEGPPHDVTLSPYFISKYEMTQGQWRGAFATNPSEGDENTYAKGWNREGLAWTALHPVEQVSWFDCVEALSVLGLVLPSEAQWERSARGDSSSVFWTGDDLQSLVGAANVADAFAKDNGGGTWIVDASLNDGNTCHAEVGSYRANSFGLYDVHGNVSEWCLDGWASPYGSNRPIDPVVKAEGYGGRVTRGGSYYVHSEHARSASRLFDTPASRVAYLGVRPARSITP